MMSAHILESFISVRYKLYFSWPFKLGVVTAVPLRKAVAGGREA